MVETGYIRPEKLEAMVTLPMAEMKNAAVCDLVNAETSSPNAVAAATCNSVPINSAVSEPLSGTPNQNTIISESDTKLNTPIAK